ncbi:MAG: hypothetical protein R8K20_08825 [Gallionellaceae bacterium]
MDKSAKESNAAIGRKLECCAQRFFLSNENLDLKLNYKIALGIKGRKSKQHAFDLGCNDKNKVLVECKSHCWTAGNHVPSAKLTSWNEAMYYFHLVPSDYRKIMFVRRDCNKEGKSLASYYLDKFNHLVPSDVEFWEYDEIENRATQIIF